jgi:hypothetical protein
VEILGVEADIVSEAVVGYAPGACLGKQPAVRDTQQQAGGLCIYQ